MALKLKVFPQDPEGDEARTSIEAWLAWTDDDPYPNLTWLVFGLPDFRADVAEKVLAYLG